MKNQLMLVILSLLSMLLFSFHWADEISRGMEPGYFSGAIGGLLILAVWLYGTLGIPDKRLGLVIILLGAILSTAVPILHMQGAGFISRHIVNTNGIFFWVWTLITLGTIGSLSLILSIRALWNFRRSDSSSVSKLP